MTGLPKPRPAGAAGRAREGRDTKEKIFRKFYMAAGAIEKRCARFERRRSSLVRRSVFVDTPAAYPGIESEERGGRRSDRREPARHDDG